MSPTKTVGVLPFAWGQLLMSRRLGLPVSGEFVGAIAPLVSPTVNGADSEVLAQMFGEWEVTYPDWRTKLLCCIAVTMNETECEATGARPGTVVLRWYPIDDLEPVE